MSTLSKKENYRNNESEIKTSFIFFIDPIDNTLHEIII